MLPIIALGALWVGQGISSVAPTVCIDPGHPSEVGRGATGKHITEIAAAWQVALKLRTLLLRDGIRVVMTKQREEQFVKNRTRADVANRAHADLMVRLHCDAGSGSGIATYVPDRPGTADGVTGPSATVIRSSREAATAFHAAMTEALDGALADKGLKPDTATAVGSRQGALTGSIFSRGPVLLVEMCVLTNPRDEAFIASDKGQSLMARALAAGTRAALARLVPGRARVPTVRATVSAHHTRIISGSRIPPAEAGRKG